MLQVKLITLTCQRLYTEHGHTETLHGLQSMSNGLTFGAPMGCDLHNLSAREILCHHLI